MRAFSLCPFHVSRVVVSLALLASASAHANLFCVGSSTELQTALTQSSVGGVHAGENNTIFLKAGTYTTGAVTSGGPFLFHAAGTTHLAIFGGFNAACTVQAPDSTLSVISGGHATQVLKLRGAGGTIELYGFSIVDGENTLGDGGGLIINPQAGDDASIVVENVIFHGNHTTHFAGAVIANSQTGSLDFSGNLLHDNSADQGVGGAELIADGTAGTVANNTVTQNTTTAMNGTGGMSFNGGPGCNCHVTNNILWNNTNVGLHLSSSVVNLEYNDIGIRDGIPPAHEVGNFSDPPLFVDPAGNDFHLKGNSPAIAASPIAGISPDLEGHGYGLGGLNDIGAYYETIFADGFD